MEKQLLQVLRAHGYAPLFKNIDTSVKDLKKAGYNIADIKATMKVYCLDDKLTKYVDRAIKP